MFPEDMPLWQRALIVLGLIVLVIALGEGVSERRKDINRRNHNTAPAQHDFDYDGSGGP